jgi:hypothetical protein
VFFSQLREACDSIQTGFAIRGGTRRHAIATSVGAITLVAELDDTLANSRVFRIATRSEAARTADGIGPGVEVSAVAERWGRIELVVSRDRLMLRAPSRETILLVVDGAADSESFRNAIEARDWKLLPPGTKVAEMVLAGLS